MKSTVDDITPVATNVSFSAHKFEQLLLLMHTKIGRFDNLSLCV
jgi:hypothetical protein